MGQIKNIKLHIVTDIKIERSVVVSTMAVGKNKRLSKGKKGTKKKIVDPFSRKDWYDVKAPSNFNVRTIGKTPVTRTIGTKIASDGLKGRVFEMAQADLNNDEVAYRKFKLIGEEVADLHRSSHRCQDHRWIPHQGLCHRIHTTSTQHDEEGCVCQVHTDSCYSEEDDRDHYTRGHHQRPQRCRQQIAA